MVKTKTIVLVTLIVSFVLGFIGNLINPYFLSGWEYLGFYGVLLMITSIVTEPLFIMGIIVTPLLFKGYSLIEKKKK